MNVSRDDAASFFQTDQLYRTIRTGLRVVGWCVTAYILRDAIFLLAGQTTRLAFELSVIGDFKFVMSISFSGAAIAWAIAERKLRHRKVENMQGRIKELERRLDPARSSSQLTPAGQTNPRDRG